ncbi:MAG TPA: LysR family transcriptional regulator [Steroidobacteraceae bacterium]|nr:LysR family transcriptional regulator [Steroidobacteraceae bacterium]
MNPRHLQAFITVAHALSFARAAEQLHLSAPALSLAIRNLERELGGALFSRSTRQVRLTLEGAEFLPQAIQLMGDWGSARDRIRQRFTLQRGHVSVAAMPSFAGSVLPQVLSEFRRRHPRVQITVHDVINEQAADMVATGRVELAFGFRPGNDPGIDFKQLWLERFVAVLPGDMEFAGKSIRWSQLMERPFITLQRPSSTRRMLEESLARHGLQLAVELETHQLFTVIQMVAAGLGVSVLPSMLARHSVASGARVLKLRNPAISQPVGVMCRSSHELSTAAAALVRCAQQAAVRPKW